jgi:adenine deaminase
LTPWPSTPCRRCWPRACATINSDDPAYFGGTMSANWLATFEALPQLGVREAWQLAANSFEASFVGAARKAEWTRRLDEVFVENSQA